MSERRYRHPQVNLRIPEELKEKIMELADSNGRSANAEMVVALEAWVTSKGKPEPKELQRINDKIASLELMIKQELSRRDEKKPT